jgi:hypothetical protein
MDTGDGVLGTNMYAYCVGDPVNLCDFSGMAGQNMPLGDGYFFRYDIGKAGNANHYHVYEGKSWENATQKWALSEDGSISHKKDWTSPGGPPNWVVKKLKKQTGFDWKKARTTYEKKNQIDSYIVPSMNGRDVTVILFQDGSARISGLLFPSITPANAKKLAITLSNSRSVAAYNLIISTLDVMFFFALPQNTLAPIEKTSFGILKPVPAT